MFILVYDNRNDDVVHMKSVGDTEGLFDCDIQIIQTSIGKELFYGKSIQIIMMKQPL